MGGPVQDRAGEPGAAASLLVMPLAAPLALPPTAPATILAVVVEDEAWYQWLLGAPLSSVIALAVGAVALVVARWMIGRTVRSIVEGSALVHQHTRWLLSRTGVEVPDPSPLAAARRAQRAQTVGSVLRSTTALVVGLAVLTALSNINGWDLGPLLASAGVAGVALGFGAQTLVKDFLSGLFMLVEDQYGVGDVVDLGEASGTVEAIGLRVTQVRDLSGTLWFVRNGEVLRVGNRTQGWSRAIVEVRVGPDQDVREAAALLREAAAALAADEAMTPLLLAEPEVTSFEDLTGESVMLRAMVKTVPAKQWEVQRALRERVRDVFVAHGVPLAVPRREVVVEREARPAEHGPSDGQDRSSTA